jgi:serine/threonine protein phosphatase PrpC
MNETAGCTRCGGTVAPDGRCWECGHTQPAYRAHVEETVEGGAAGVGDRGLRRDVNADAMALGRAGAWTVGVVCDGVSLSFRAERAARMAAEVGVDSLVRQLGSGVLPEVALAGAAVRAHHAVAALAGTAPPARGDALEDVAPACTFLAGVAGPEGVWSASVGDSRAYWLPDEGPGMRLTEDDTSGLDALTAWLGADADEPVARVRGYRPPCPGRLLLCTDGLWRHLPGVDELRTAAGRGSALDGARALVSHALSSGGHDNVTAVLIPVAACVPGR